MVTNICTFFSRWYRYPKIICCFNSTTNNDEIYFESWIGGKINPNSKKLSVLVLIMTIILHLGIICNLVLANHLVLLMALKNKGGLKVK